MLIKSFVDFAWQDNLFCLHQTMVLMNNLFDKPTVIFKLVLYFNQIVMH